MKSPVIATVICFSGKVFYRIDFATPLEAGKDIKVEVETFFPHTLTPFPSEIAQSEKQLVKFTTNTHFYSPYKTTKQTTTINTVSSNIESYTKTVKPVSAQDNAVTYGPFENKGAFSEVCVNYWPIFVILFILCFSLRIIKLDIDDISSDNISHPRNSCVEMRYCFCDKLYEKLKCNLAK